MPPIAVLQRRWPQRDASEWSDGFCATLRAEDSTLSVRALLARISGCAAQPAVVDFASGGRGVHADNSSSAFANHIKRYGHVPRAADRSLAPATGAGPKAGG